MNDKSLIKKTERIFSQLYPNIDLIQVTLSDNKLDIHVTFVMYYYPSDENIVIPRKLIEGIRSFKRRLS